MLVVTKDRVWHWFAISGQYMPNAVVWRGLGHDVMRKRVSKYVKNKTGKRPIGMNCQYMPNVALGASSS